MGYRLLADAVLIVHLGFIAFVVLGGLVVLRRSWVAWLHLPAVAWGAWIEFTGGVCPLTPLEIGLRARGGGQTYSGGFIERYITALLYPDGLDRRHQIVLGAFVLVLNSAVYGWLAWRWGRGPSQTRSPSGGSSGIVEPTNARRDVKR